MLSAEPRSIRNNIHKSNFLLTKARKRKYPPYMCTSEIVQGHLVGFFLMHKFSKNAKTSLRSPRLASRVSASSQARFKVGRDRKSRNPEIGKFEVLS